MQLPLSKRIPSTYHVVKSNKVMCNYRKICDDPFGSILAITNLLPKPSCHKNTYYIHMISFPIGRVLGYYDGERNCSTT